MKSLLLIAMTLLTWGTAAQGAADCTTLEHNLSLRFAQQEAAVLAHLNTQKLERNKRLQILCEKYRDTMSAYDENLDVLATPRLHQALQVRRHALDQELMTSAGGMIDLGTRTLTSQKNLDSRGTQKLVMQLKLCPDGDSAPMEIYRSVVVTVLSGKPISLSRQEYLVNQLPHECSRGEQRQDLAFLRGSGLARFPAQLKSR